VTALTQSDALHRAVQDFAERALAGVFSRSEQTAQFDALAVRVAQYQAQHCDPIRRLFSSHGLEVSSLSSVTDLPALPSDAFRLSRVACHEAALDAVKYRTSGTTARRTGEHCLRTVATYRKLSTLLGRQALLGRAVSKGMDRATVVALLPEPGQIPHSSLGAMCRFFMEELDGRVLPGEDEALPIAERPTRWLVREDSVDVAQLRSATEAAALRGEALLLLATSLSLQLLVRDHGTDKVRLPASSVVMQTGGNKGRHEQVDPQQLSHRICDFFQITPAAIIGEYGMTELGSQLYEGVHWQPLATPGVYFAPPWLEAVPVDPVTLEPVREGEVGLARFVDLANVDSAMVILTRDLIRREGEGIRLHGRQPGSPLRGCSLLIEPVREGSS
jgi:hypothetical protein